MFGRRGSKNFHELVPRDGRVTTRGDTRGPACATRRTRSLSPLSARAWARALPGQKSESAGQRNWNAWPGVERLKPIDRCTTVDRLYPRNSIEMKFFFRSFEIFINRSIVESTRSLNFPIEFFFHAREIRPTRIESKYLQHEEPITLIRSANKFLAKQRTRMLRVRDISKWISEWRGVTDLPVSVRDPMGRIKIVLLSSAPERGEETVEREGWQKTILGMVLTPT